jgi:hypothetical protein
MIRQPTSDLPPAAITAVGRETPPISPGETTQSVASGRSPWLAAAAARRDCPRPGVVARILGSHPRRRSFVTRLWHWAASGAALPAVAILGLATLVTAGQGRSSVVTNFGSALLALVLLVPASVVVATLLGGGVLAVARRLPPRAAPQRRKAVLLASATVFVGGTVSGAPLLPFASSDGLPALAVLVHGLVFAILPTTAAAVA